MESQYEILDARYWQREWEQEGTVKVSAGEILKTICLIGLGIFFWQLAAEPGARPVGLLNLLGLVFALWSYITIRQIHIPDRWWRQRITHRSKVVQK